MSTPMFDIPEHFYLPCNDKLQGPVEVYPDYEAGVWNVCWCYLGPECEVLPVQALVHHLRD